MGRLSGHCALDKRPFLIKITMKILKKSALLTVLSLCTLLSNAETTERLYLSGTGSDNTRTWDFYCSDGQNSKKHSKIEVPSCWELQGFGDYTYGRFYKTEGAVPSKETGFYTTSFTIPASMSGKLFRIVFEGSMTDTRVLIDGKQVGPVHQGGFTEFSYDVTPYIRPGKKQKLEVEVSKESANASVNSAERRADWWLFGGIYRPVYIEALPSRHISGVSIDARADGKLTAKIRTNGASPSDAVNVTLDGRKPRTMKAEYSDAEKCFIVKADFPDVSVWTPETPNLHNVTFTLGGKNGHSVTERIGFRTIEFVPHDGLYLNGRKLIVKGTNRHCFHPETGRATSKALSISDARLLKYMNMNAVRCHYPSDRHFLEACDSLGLLYLDEFPGWQTRYDDTTAVKLLPEFVQRDVNHPCVFIWANGNEGGWNTAVDSLFAVYDPQHRKVVHPWADFDGIDTHHYPAYQTGAYRLQNGRNVFMPTEFLHGQYDKGQGAGLEDFWNHWLKSPRFAGGFIWAFVDEAVRRTDMPTGKSAGLSFRDKKFDITDCILDSDGSNGPDGCVDPYRQPEASVFTIRELWSPVYIDRLEVLPSFKGEIPVENRWIFTSLGDCSMQYRLLQCVSDSVVETARGTVALPSIEPGERGFARFEVPDGFRDNDILELTAFSPAGDELCSWSAFIRNPKPSRAAAKGEEKVKVIFTDNGMIERITKGEEIIPLSGGPLPVGMMAECYDHSRHIEADGTEVNTFRYRGGVDSIRWELTPDGLLSMNAVLLNSANGHRYKGNFITEEGGWQIGLTFNYPEENVERVRWTGVGPYRVWRNREKGGQYGVWNKEYNNTVTGQYGTSRQPVYPEFKGYHADVRDMDIVARDGKGFSVSTDTERMYVRLFTPEEPSVKSLGEMGGPNEKAIAAAAKRSPEKTMVKFPEGDISFLLSIPPMRSYKPLHQQGPESQPDVIRIKPGDDGFHLNLTFDFN